MTRVRFNAFQQVMRLWDRVHPYNAGQMLRLDHPADATRWNEAWRATLKFHAIGEVAEEQASYAQRAPSRPRDLAVIPADIAIEDWIAQQMNRLFDADDAQPFLPFLKVENGTSHVGIMYRHWIADSAAIRMLLREWFLRALYPEQSRATPFEPPAGGMWHYFGPEAARWNLAEGIGALARLRTRFSRARPVQPITGTPMNMRFSVHALPDGTADRLLAFARPRGLKLTDLFLAATALACEMHGVNPRVPGREDLAFGTIVDMRPMSRRRIDDVFGNFLGFTTTIVRGTDLTDWPRALDSIAAQSELHRRTRAAPAGVLRLAAGLLEARFMPPDQWCLRYRRQMPMAAGISNVNLSDSWAARFHPAPIIDYVRISPLGPLLPLVLTPTTLARRLHIGLSRQVSLIDETRAGRIIGTVIHRLCRLV